MKRLTKERLIELGVTDVTEDGQVYINGKKRKATLTTKATKYGGKKSYYIIAIPDKSCKVPSVQRIKTKKGIKEVSHYSYKAVTIPLARLMLAWFTGCIEANEDADHIDNDSLNNHIDNLQKISRRENLAKRSLSWKEINSLYYTHIYKKLKPFTEAEFNKLTDAQKWQLYVNAIDIAKQSVL